MLSVAVPVFGPMRYLMPLLVKKNEEMKHDGTSAGNKNNIDI